MDYYEELGLSHAASSDEIRSVHKTLVRLLHPDGQTDEAARRVAEQQLKRLNNIIDILLNPSRRRRYDLSLEMPPAPFHPGFVPPPVVVARRINPISAVLLLAAGALMGTAVEYFWTSGPNSPQYAQAAFRGDSDRPPTPSSDTEAASPLPRIVKPPRARLSEGSALVVPPPSRHMKPSPMAELSEAPFRRPEIPTLMQAQTNPPTPIPESVSSPTPSPTPLDKLSQEAAMLSGAWLYAPQVDRPAAALYAPEFVELYSKVDGGMVSGRFRSRYYVTNQPLSPDVNFVFQGPLSLSGFSGDWVAPDGSRGTIDLRLLPTGVLEVKWVRTKAGTDRTLAYGKAILVKSVE